MDANQAPEERTPAVVPPPADPVALEEAIAERVIARLLAARPSAPLQLAGGELIDGAGPVPPADGVAAPPRGAVLRPPEMIEAAARRGWVLLQVWGELRHLPRMYFDPRYRLSRTAQFAVPLALALLALNYLFFNHLFTLAVVAPVLECVANVVVGVLLYKVLVRELARYAEVLDYLQKYGFR